MKNPKFLYLITITFFILKLAFDIIFFIEKYQLNTCYHGINKTMSEKLCMFLKIKLLFNILSFEYAKPNIRVSDLQFLL